MIDISKLHEDILVIADSFHEFCCKNNIHYFLLGGTALGAARHQGFIPWDDDFDVCMDFKNYKKFIRLWELKGPSENLYLQNENTNEWPLYFSKLRLNNSIYLEKEDLGRVMHNGVYIDIMCLNKLGNYRLTRWFQFFSAKLLTAEALSRRGYKASSIFKMIIMFFAWLVVKVVGRKVLLKIVRSKNKDISCNLFGHFFGRAPYRKSIISSEQIGEGQLVKFSKRQYFSFSNLSEYLKNRFGENFMDMPSEETKASFPSHCIKYIPRGTPKSLQ